MLFDDVLLPRSENGRGDRLRRLPDVCHSDASRFRNQEIDFGTKQIDFGTKDRDSRQAILDRSPFFPAASKSQSSE